MRWILFGITLFATIAAAIAVIGAFLPIKHVATASADVPLSPTDVWAKLTTGIDAKTYAVITAEAPRHLVTRIIDRKLPYGGEWDYTIEPTTRGSHVTITERGEIYNPLFRFISRYVMGYTATMQSVLKGLADGR